jgi:plasmid stability protein
MPGDTVRSTVYIDADLHQAVRLKAATAHRSISDVVNEALRDSLGDEQESPGAPAGYVREAAARYEQLLTQLKADLRPLAPSGTSAAVLLERWRHLPSVDPVAFRRDIDDVLDASL